MFLADLARVLDMRAWQLQEAKNQLSEVIEIAQGEGPQIITRHAQPRAVLLSFADYEAMTSHRPDFREWLLGGPKVDLASYAAARREEGEGEG